MSTPEGRRQANYEFWLQQEKELLTRREEAYNVGGQKQIERLAKQGKVPVRQLIEKLVDPGEDFLELGLVAP